MTRQNYTSHQPLPIHKTYPRQHQVSFGFESSQYIIARAYNKMTPSLKTLSRNGIS